MRLTSPSHSSHDNLVNESDFLDYAANHGFGDVHFKVDKETGMVAIIAIHSTKLGPALGGCRFIEYPDNASAIYDALRLARGMSYKAASVNLPLGGGKSVIIKPKGAFDREKYMRSFGQFVADMQGRYITALDSGTQLSDMDIIAQYTPHVASLSRYDGDPSPYTALGIFKGIAATAAWKLKKDSLQGLHVAVQGLGHVGLSLVRQLYEAGATCTVSDINPMALQTAKTEFGATIVDTADIYKIPCDIFAPCALGAILNDDTIDNLQTSIVAGAANNQLAHTRHGQILHEKGILYAPDYVINAGGLIYAASKYFDTPEKDMFHQLEAIPYSLTRIFDRSLKENLPTSVIADDIAREKLA